MPPRLSTKSDTARARVHTPVVLARVAHPRHADADDRGAVSDGQRLQHSIRVASQLDMVSIFGSYEDVVDLEDVCVESKVRRNS